MDDFYKKYESQRVKWEMRKNLKPMPVTAEDEGIGETSFKPSINTKSRKLAKDIEKIENRVKMLNEGKQKRI